MFSCSSKSTKAIHKACSDIQHVSYRGAGAFTFKVEGDEGGAYASRYLHVPSKDSGLTLGRGYDMRDKTPQEIQNDLEEAGIAKEDAKKLSKAAKKKGGDAKSFIMSEKLDEFSITPEQQEKLFKISYSKIKKNVMAICSKPDVLATYGATDFDKLHPAIHEVLIDLRYRGDYTGSDSKTNTRKYIQPAVAANDLVKFRDAVAQIPGVPEERMKERLKYLDAAILEQRKNLPLPVHPLVVK